MKLAYLDCASGISGDMTLGALIDAGADLQAVQAGIDSLGLPDCRLSVAEVTKKGFRAVQLRVEHAPEHAHRHLHHITAMIDRSSLTDRQKELATAIFTRLGEAEAKVHGTTIEKVHFHEVGAVDSIADIVGAAIGFDLLGIDRLIASPIPTGCGFVDIAHGRCSIPAPATGELLRGVPLAASNVEAELTTPTGAAILAALADGYGPVPAMTIEAIGYGAGERDLEQQPNLLRLLVGTGGGSRYESDQVWVVETNLDDSSGELVGHCTLCLWEAGALDVTTTAIQMKKNRPGVKLTILCHDSDLEAIEAVLFRETTTLGIRRWPASRHMLSRAPYTVETPWGRIAGTIAQPPGETSHFSPEYETCRKLARDQNVSLRDVYHAAQAAFAQQRAESERPRA